MIPRHKQTQVGEWPILMLLLPVVERPTHPGLLPEHRDMGCCAVHCIVLPKLGLWEPALAHIDAENEASTNYNELLS
jgi:hypothetical protein